MTIQDLVNSAKALAPMERMELVDMIIGTLNDTSPEWNEAWTQEAGRRAKAIDEGNEALFTWDEVRSALRKE